MWVCIILRATGMFGLEGMRSRNPLALHITSIDLLRRKIFQIHGSDEILDNTHADDVVGWDNRGK